MRTLPLLSFLAIFACAVTLLPPRSLAQDFGPPLLSVSVSQSPSPQPIYYSAIGGGGPFAVVSDNEGLPIYSWRTPILVTDFKQQANGDVTYFDLDSNGFVVEDANYNYLQTVRPVGDYAMDSHDFVVLPNGNFLFMVYDTLAHYDATALVGTERIVDVIGTNIQEVRPDNSLVFEWKGFDPGHFRPEDMQYPNEMTSEYMDAIHGNAVSITPDGNILLSSRNLSELTKIDPKTGQIIWRLGGKNNQFEFIGDTIGFSYQHCARFVSDSDILLFDNGVHHSPQFSRAVEYRIDEANHTATLVWQFDHRRTVFAPVMGSTQRLPNGNTLIGWGLSNYPNPAVTEVRMDGTVSFEATLPPGVVSYRMLRTLYQPDAAVHVVPEGRGLYLTPNPASSQVRITSAEAGAFRLLRIYDVTGRLALTTRDREVDVRTLPNGVYQIQVVSESGIQTERLLVQH